MNWLQALERNRRRGSFPRCLLLMSGSPEVVSARLTHLVAVDGVTVGPSDRWMPSGIPLAREDGTWAMELTREAKLGQAPLLLGPEHRASLTSWWLASPGRANEPNWDIASTCRIHGRPGLLLIEAKAHDQELLREAKGKPLERDASTGTLLNHARIGDCIADESQRLTRDTKLVWSLSRDAHYQLSNRFAWSARLASLGVPVVLVYLGFLRAEEMSDRGRPFATPEDWKQLVERNTPAVPGAVWEREQSVGGVVMLPVIRAIEIRLDGLETTSGGEA